MSYIATLVDQLSAGEAEVTSVKEEINELTYKIFDISSEERRTIKRYLKSTSSK